MLKPLLSKTTKPFIIYVLVILLMSIPVYYIIVDTIWQNELDEHNKTVAEKTAFEFNHLKLSDADLEKSIKLWNRIQPETNIEKLKYDNRKRDQYFTIEKAEKFSVESEIERYRCLEKVVYINNKPFLFTIQTNIEESRETILAIALNTAFFFIIIVLGLLILNRRLSAVVWSPFRNTLNQLKNFNLNNQNKIEFEKTDTKEFEELHQSLSKLIDHSISVYQTQKEFTENASHELQTPLAIIKHKLDILLQDRDLTSKQYEIAEDIHRAIKRSSRINKDLLLLAKIENSQFDAGEKILMDEMINQSIESLEDYFRQKNIKVNASLEREIFINGNQSLTEICINNLLVNTIRHSSQNGFINITLSKSSFEIANIGTGKLDETLLFKRFSKISTHHKGSGLGLSIIYEICKFHGWIIQYSYKENLHIFRIDF